MADETTTAPAADTTTPAAPAPAAATEPAKEAAKPGIDPSEAARILANARSKVARPKAAAAKGKEAPATEPPKANAPAAPVPPTSQKTDSATAAAKPGETSSPEGEKPKAKTPDEEAAEALARAVQEDRRVKAAAKALEEKTRAAEAEISFAKTIKQAAEQGPLAVLKAAYPDKDLTEQAFWDLLEALKVGEDAPALDPAKIPEIVDQRIKEREEAAAKARQEAAEREIQAAADTYAEACAMELKANVSKYPLVARRGVSSETVDAYVRSVYAKTRSVPEPDAVLAHFEARFLKELEGTPYAPKPPPPAPAPSPTVNSSWTRDSGAKTSPEGKQPSLEEKTQMLRERLRQLDRERAGARA